jgi:hypothetical protein
VKKRFKIYGSILLSLIAVYALVTFGNADLSAITWHLRHGFHVDLLHTRLRVPFTFEADDAEAHSIWLARRPGILWHEGGFIWFNFASVSSPEALEAAEAILQKRGFKPPESPVNRSRVGEQATVFAGHPGRCLEYNLKMVDLHIDAYEIHCWFSGDVETMFLGSPRLRDDFYNIIQTAEPLTVKN